MKNLDETPPKGPIIVLDTAALITGSDNLYALAALTDTETSKPIPPSQLVTFYTVPDVITEVRDKRARAKLSLLDGAIVIRPPSSDALAAVINFAKATGDFAVLSMTDLKVIALCWMLEMERNGGSFLKEPPRRVLVNEIRCGTLIPFHELDAIERQAREADEREAEDWDDWQVVKGRTAQKGDEVAEEFDDDTPQTFAKDTTKTERKRRRRRRRKKPVSSEDTTEIPQSAIEEQSSPVETNADDITADMHEMNIHEDDQAPNEELEAADNAGWINIDNLEEHLAREGGEEEQTQQDHDRIGCVTTDFAMQNTMLQMGLKLLSVDGRRAIKKIKHFALRCHTCGTISTEVERAFCHRCGNATMHRVAFKVDKKGVARSYLNPKKKPVLRGTKYPIPMPRGGRHNRDLILCEDQIDPVKQKRLQKQRERLNVDVLDPSNFYNAGARFDPHNRPLVVGYGRRNPNEVHRTSRRKR